MTPDIKIKNLTNNKADIWKIDKDTYKVVALDLETAKLLHRATKYYPSGTTFEEGEQPMFKFHYSKTRRVSEITDIDFHEIVALPLN